MIVSLYTSRIVLEQLGASDYGIYSLVGGVVAMFGFLNAAMSSATQRYLSFDIGKGDDKQLKKTFSSVFTIHILISILILILSETIGLWYVNTKMVFPQDRIFAVNIVYQASVLAAILKVVQVPFNALIIAREKMQVYAYIGIFEVLLKLLFVISLIYFGEDKLITHAILVLVLNLVINLMYQAYTNKKFTESGYSMLYDKSYFNELLSFSGWSLFGNLAAVSRTQGLNLVLNLFFSTVINAAYGLSAVVQSAFGTFVSSFQVAVNPQIIKYYAQGNLEEMKKLIYSTSKFNFFLLLIIGTPVIINIDFILQLWLKDVPEKTSIFVVLSIIYIMIDSISYSLITAVQATGKIRNYQAIVGSFIFLTLPLSYTYLLFFNIPEGVFYILILITFLTLILRMVFVKKLFKIHPMDFFKNVLLRIFYIVFVLLIILYLINKTIPLSKNNILDFILISLLITTVTSIVIIFFGLRKSEKEYLLTIINDKWKK